MCCNLFVFRGIFNLSVWNKMYDFGIIEIRRLAAILKMLK